MINRRTIRWVTRGVVLAVLAGAPAVWWWKHSSAEGPQFQSAVVTRGELVQVVTASGQLNPVVKVEVGSQISGNIQKLLADFNSPVKEGQLIAKLDPATYEANFIQAEGNLANAKAALELAQINAERAQALQSNNLIARADYDKATADLHQAQANVKINEGALKKAQADLSRCAIYAPIDGMVISRNVNAGQTVAASLSAPILFVIAKDLAKMQIDADVAEADIGLVEEGQDVSFTVDAFPGKTFEGKVTQIRNAPKAEQNVVTYDTIITVNNPKLKLKPGMTANVSIIVARQDNAVKVPNAALRFRPPAGAEGSKLLGGGREVEGPASSTKKPDATSRKKDKHKTERTVFVLASSRNSGSGSTNRVPQAVVIKTGINDGKYTDAIEGLKEGEEVVIGMNQAKSRLGDFDSLLGVKKKH